MATIKTICTTNYNEEDYLDAFLEENGLVKEDYQKNKRVWSHDFYDFCDTEKRIEFGNEMGNIACHELNHGKKKYVVSAIIEKWDGPVDGGKVLEGMGSVIAACINEDFNIYLDGKQMKIRAPHHDGVDMFTIKELTKAGERFYELHKDEWGRREMCEKLFSDHHLSRHVTIWKEMYGM